LAVGLFLFFTSNPSRDTSGGKNGNPAKWVKELLEYPNFAESSISFAIAGMTVVGYIYWIVYTAYGLSAFPIGIIRGRKHIAEDASNIQNTLDTTREKANAIKSKYLSRDKKISKRDEENLELLKRKERALSKQNERLEATGRGWRAIWMLIKPFAFLFGILFYLVSLLIIVSILLTNIDKAVNAGDWCGAQCGFVIAYPKIFNPFDSLLTLLSKYFPLDYVLLAGVIFYIFFCTLSGIAKISVRFLWIKMYSIRPKATPPQGLLLSAIILMFAILALNMEITTLAPHYANFGSQVWKNGTSGELQSCSMDAPPTQCSMTEIGKIINRISVRTNFFGMIYFGATWLFLLMFLIGTIVAIFKSKASNIETKEEDSDEDED